MKSSIRCEILALAFVLTVGCATTPSAFVADPSMNPAVVTYDRGRQLLDQDQGGVRIRVIHLTYSTAPGDIQFQIMIGNGSSANISFFEDGVELFGYRGSEWTLLRRIPAQRAAQWWQDVALWSHTIRPGKAYGGVVFFNGRGYERYRLKVQVGHQIFDFYFVPATG